MKIGDFRMSRREVLTGLLSAALVIASCPHESAAQALRPGHLPRVPWGGFPSLDYDFVRVMALAPEISFSRASSGTYRDNTGTRQTAGVNQPRFDHDKNGNALGLLTEEARTNFLLNSGSPANQTTGALSTGLHTLWVEGSGSVAVAQNSATITGAGTATEGSPVVFNVTSGGTVDVTVSGSVSLFQLENGANATSYIPTTGSTASRSADFVSASLGGKFNPTEGTFLFVGSIPHVPNAAGVIPHLGQMIDAGSTNILAPGRYVSNSILIRTGVTIGGVQTGIDAGPGTMRNGNLERVAFGYAPFRHASTRNAQLAVNNAVGVPSGIIPTLAIGRNIATSDSQWWNGHIRRVAYWSHRLEDAQLIAITEPR